MGGDESDDDRISVGAPSSHHVECISSPNVVDQSKQNHSPVDVTCLDEVIEEAAINGTQPDAEGGDSEKFKRPINPVAQFLKTGETRTDIHEVRPACDEVGSALRQETYGEDKELEDSSICLRKRRKVMYISARTD